MLTKRKKHNTIQQVQRHQEDTGSPEAQIALLTRRIEELSAHLKKHAKDLHSRRGLLQMVADRRKHLKYLERKSPQRHQQIVEQLGLKKK
jgi:small subunit ribosomal protein S15